MDPWRETTDFPDVEHDFLSRPGSAAAYQIVRLACGAHSVRSLAHRETFHPVVGPVAEAEALYIKQLRLLERLGEHRGEFVIWDVGLGAAANVLAAIRATRDIPCSLRIVSFDHTLDPLRFALNEAKLLEDFAGYEEIIAALIERGRSNFSAGPQEVSWELCLGDFPKLIEQPPPLPKPHVIFFDAYSPQKNPSMWTQPLFARIFKNLDPNRACALATYSRSTLLRVTLLLAGFFVGAGRATGEKEETTIAANRIDLLDYPLATDWLARVRRSTSAEPLWEADYRQIPVSQSSWELLRLHEQFRSHPG